MKAREKVETRKARKNMKAGKARKKIKARTKQRYEGKEGCKAREHIKHVGT